MKQQYQIGTPSVLLVEDNLGDVRLVGEALSGVAGNVSVHAVYDGAAALDYLHRRARYSGAPRPSLVLLDWNLPKKSGREVLAEIKADPDLKRIPVVVFSSSRSPADVLDSYALHANCYVVKPFDLEQWMETVRSVAHFWLQVAAPPPADDGTH